MLISLKCYHWAREAWFDKALLAASRPPLAASMFSPLEKCFMLKEAAGTVSQPVHFGYILLGAFWSFEIFWHMFSRWIMFIPLNTLFHQGERQNAEREACGKNGRAIFDSSTSAHPPIRPLLPFSIFLFHRSYSFSFLFSGARLPDRDQCTMKSRNPARKSPDLSAGPEVRTRLNNIE